MGVVAWEKGIARSSELLLSFHLCVAKESLGVDGLVVPSINTWASQRTDVFEGSLNQPHKSCVHFPFIHLASRARRLLRHCRGG